MFSDLQTLIRKSVWGEPTKDKNHHACEIIITRSLSVLSHRVKDNESQSWRGIKKDSGSKASETKGESLNLSSSLQNERRIEGWIISAKP